MNTIWIVMPILVVLMFLLGTDLDKKAFEGVTKNPRAILAGMTGQIILLPLIAFLIAWALKLPPVYFMGLTLVACCPGGSSSSTDMSRSPYRNIASVRGMGVALMVS